MAEHPNVELLRKALDAFSRGDLETVRSLWADDIVYHFSGASPLAGDYRGEDGVLSFFTKAAKLSGGTLRVAEVHDVLANDEHGVALVRFTASREGRDLSMNQANIYHIRDGKIREVWGVPVDQAALDEILS